MKKIALILLGLVIISSRAWAMETYPIDKVHSSVGFSIAHLVVSKVAGAFNEFDGAFHFDPNDLAGSSFEITIQVNSIDTKNEQRDKHLRSADFFDAEKYGLITFKTKSIVKKDGNDYLFTGDLTMKGVTKEVSLPVTVLGPQADPMGGGELYGLESHFTVNRQDYGVSWNKTLDNGGFVLGDNVDVTVSIAAEKK